jgi:hypothetical protein
MPHAPLQALWVGVFNSSPLGARRSQIETHSKRGNTCWHQLIAFKTSHFLPDYRAAIAKAVDEKLSGITFSINARDMTVFKYMCQGVSSRCDYR